ncbi:polysaccharide deacetylase family protein [Azospirillum sp. TSH100]|uniref:polysaccharide deacetylase family protein n=1 Tax=Azospirillum sp. TSH100 TaxID=652764 RepID=UPI000D659490|nr:polysaccharide deacetylase family protein [Azospirillum sp. TSH100]QCG91053.1 polysaccharide deacetylase family protein [Azospirillum sp. TSH100]
MSTCFLVYHRLTADAAVRRFHDVAPAMFERHLDLLGRLGACVSDGSPTMRLADGRGVALTFDDGSVDQLAAARSLDRRGWHGIFFISAGRIGEPGRLDRADVAALAESGHIVGCHGWSHRRFDRLSAKELAAELSDSRECLGALTGGAVDWLAPPGGIWTPAAADAAGRLGFRHIRGTAWGVAPDGWETVSAVVPAIVLSGQVGPRALDWLLKARPDGLLDRLAGLKAGIKRQVGEAIWDRVREAMRR